MLSISHLSFSLIFAIGGLVTLALMICLWLVSLMRADASIVDPFWGAGFVLLTWVYFALTPEGFLGRKLLLCTLATVWGMRLSLYLLWRNWGQGEDFRYRTWRAEAGAQWWWHSLGKVFLLQGGLLWLISAPLLAAQFSATPQHWTPLDFLATAVWGIGFFFEAAGDWQLARFKADPANKGKLLTTGVWRYSRHPNYFGDAAQWWAYYLLALTAGGWYTLFSPLLMTFLLRYVSGVTLLEKTLRLTKPGYAAYAASTNAFFPWFPKKKAS